MKCRLCTQYTRSKTWRLYAQNSTNQFSSLFQVSASVSSSVLSRVKSTGWMNRLKGWVVKKCVHCPRPSRCYAQQGSSINRTIILEREKFEIKKNSLNLTFISKNYFGPTLFAFLKASWWYLNFWNWTNRTQVIQLSHLSLTNYNVNFAFRQ